MLPVEPLHELKEHINNIFKEPPKDLTDKEKVLFDETMEAVLSKKEKLRGSDYRLCCAVLAPWKTLPFNGKKATVDSYRTF